MKSKLKLNSSKAEAKASSLGLAELGKKKLEKKVNGKTKNDKKEPHAFTEDLREDQGAVREIYKWDLDDYL